MRSTRAFAALLLSTAAAACAGGRESDPVDTIRSGALTAGALDAVLTVNSDWTTGYCAEIKVTNHTASPVSDWAVGLDIKQSAISQSWNATFTSTGGSTYSVTPLPADPILWGNSMISVGFCGTSAQGGAAFRPVVTSLTCAGGACSGSTGAGGTTGTAGTSGSGGAVTAQKVFGQPTLGDTVVNQIVANRTFHPQGVAVQRNATTAADRVYVVDSGNQRVLGFRALGTCSNQTTRECTNNGECTSPGTCVITGTRNADISIGQPNLTTGTCNGDNSRSMPASASTLCMQPYPRAISLLESPDTLTLAIDSTGALYVPDKWNHRVLKYNDPFATDGVADRVWGQNDFTSRACNQGLSAPTKSTLCLNSETTQVHVSGNEAGAGVEVSPDGKVWVADQGNGRVLRFLPDRNEADLVLGQPDFTTGARDPNECRVGGTNTGARLCFPKAVRYDATNNKVYVLEWRGSGGLDWNNADYRVLVYAAPFTNGMAATEIITGTAMDPNASPPITACWTTGSTLCLRRPTGIELAPGVTNAFWLADSDFSRVLYIDKSTGSWKPRKVLSQPNLSQFGDIGVNCATGNNDDCLAQHPGGGIGIDSAGNILIAETGNARVMRYAANVPDAPVTGGVAIAPTAQLFPIVPGQYGVANYNRQSGAGFIAPHVVRMVSYPNGAKQLLARDAWRVLFWNNYDQTSVGNGASANGALYQPNLASNAPNDLAPAHIADIDFDAQGHVYVAVADRIDMFTGPLVQGQTGASVHLSNLPFALNQGNTGTVDITGIAYQASTGAMFVADTLGHRVLRVSNPFGASPVVDLVLGQRSAAHRGPNRDRDIEPNTPAIDCLTVQPDSFARTGELRFDRQGNLYVTDTTHEGWQCSNNRIVEYDAAQLIVDAAHPFFCGSMDSTYDDTPAEQNDPARSTCGTARKPRRLYGPDSFTAPEPQTVRPGKPTYPFAVAFDAQNRMILSTDAYGNLNTERVYYYANPVPTCTVSGGCVVSPTAIFPATNGQPASVAFDAAGNLALLDHTWNRVLFYKAADMTAWMAAH
jgi:hypothetical protein